LSIHISSYSRFFLTNNKSSDIPGYPKISISLSHFDDKQASFLPLKIRLAMSATVLCCPHFRDSFQRLRSQLDEAIADHRHGNDLAESQRLAEQQLGCSW
jgi:hypothetical protein